MYTKSHLTPRPLHLQI